jgi:flagellar hook-associated protein 2
VQFKVNGVTFNYDFSTSYDNGATIGARNKSISDILSDISSKANVDFSYSQVTRGFTLSSKGTGADQIIKDTQDLSGTNFLLTILGQSNIADASGNLYKPDGTIDTSKQLNGTDAVITIKPPSISNIDSNPGIQLTRSTNNFTLDGINYSLNSKTDDFVNLNLNSNPQKTFDKIKGFVDKYNEIIDKINSKLFEKRQYNYKPLTDDQKKDMKEDDIKKWEDKAKQGLLGNDSTLSNMLYRMRNAFYDSVKTGFDSSSGIGISLSEIGIKTSSDVGERGKLVIDETTLKAAIQNNGDKVMQLFTKTSMSVPSYDSNATSTDKDKRYKELGIFQRISDILQDNLRTLRDNNGKKGMLLERAGIKGDLSEFKNLLTEDIQRRDKVIKEMTSKLADKENRYYIQFSKLESAMQKMNSQSSWLSQQLGSMNG